MPPASPAAYTDQEPRIPYAAYPFGAFAMQQILGDARVPTSPEERSGTA